MLGVVLWRDTSDEKALIWCEDHGDLAVCSRKGEATELSLHVGDCVQFDLALDCNVRLAQNPRVVQPQMYPDIADRLKAMARGDAPAAPKARKGNVISFAAARAQKTQQESVWQMA
ncbi:hypothetical protein [Chachezhania sediminis]|uniref:hypothetical protein n=1 Tax=Chachezhania sediminis TaxID=2599291 RepID=UPI00131D8E06|nr:hypothetical protein [Chachezhania sediminis]